MPTRIPPHEPILSCKAARPRHFPGPPGRGRDGQYAVAWADVGVARDPEPELSLDWALLQLIPSPELAVGDGGARFGLRWQVTPVLYSFATDARLSRFRGFIAEPIVRQSGSIELYVSPEYLTLDGGIGASFGVRGGLRSYFGVYGRGDNLSLSLASEYYYFRDERGVAFEAGAHVLFGALGLVVGYAPSFEAARWLTSIRLRYF